MSIRRIGRSRRVAFERSVGAGQAARVLLFTSLRSHQRNGIRGGVRRRILRCRSCLIRSLACTPFRPSDHCGTTLLDSSRDTREALREVALYNPSECEHRKSRSKDSVLLSRRLIMKASIVPADPEVVHRRYPHTGLVAGWFFQCEEVSIGCYVAEGCDLYGRQISSECTDADAALQQCVASARQLVQTSSSTA